MAIICLIAVMASSDSAITLIAVLFSALLLLTITAASTSNTSSRSCIESERSALVNFKQSLTDESNRLSSWVGDDCCSWQGVGCSRGGNIVKLDLRNPVTIVYGDHYTTSLGGQISPSLLILKHLRYLDLSSNAFTSAEIPGFLGSFMNMNYLNLSNSNFMGEVPHSLGNLSSTLEYLDLGYNIQLASTNSLSWVSRLTSLKHLDLSTVIFENVTDLLHSINMLPSLQVLNLASASPCSFPQSLSQQVTITSLVSLDLSGNCINSTLPLWLSNNTGLMHLKLGTNDFHGPIPDIFGSFTSLTFLDLSGNHFDSSLEMSSLFGNLSSLAYLDLRYGSFYGSIPPEIGNLTQLQHLDLSLNWLEGEIPRTFRNLRFLRKLNLRENNFNGAFSNLLGNLNASLQNSLQQLDLSTNKFSGSIPTSLGRLSSLTVLDISSNHLSGSIPSSLGQLSELETLLLSNNSLSGMVSEHHFARLSRLVEVDLSLNSLSVLNNASSQWIPPFQLEGIYMDSCILGPKFPQWLRTQRHFLHFSASNASISDTIPNWFGNVFSQGDLWSLDLSHNRISGQLPNISSRISILDLSNNLLSGNITSELCKFEFAQSVDLSQNQFSGRLHSCLGNLSSLMVLDLSSNNIYGRIPSSLGSLGSLMSFHLHNNRLYGELPQSLQNMRSLDTLDLGNNNITGVIPSWIGKKLSKLRILGLQSNKFHSDIPLQLCNLVHLQLLNLANNSISGSIPTCLNNLTAMTANDLPGGGYSWYEENIFATLKGTERKYTKTIKYLTSIDLSNNNITGEIPNELTSLIGLKGLSLGGNHLEGWIPDNIGNLKQLESLDLSRNRLSGPVPQSLSNLNYLSYLNLSFNNLSGRVPTGNQLQTLGNLSSIYMGNNGLCGAPIMKRCPGDEVSLDHGPEQVGESESGDDNEHLWFYAGIGPGFVVGLLGFFSSLYFKKSWRHAYFQSLENFHDWFVVNRAVKLAQVRRKFNRGELGTRT